MLALTRKLIGRHPQCLPLISVPPSAGKNADYLNPTKSSSSGGAASAGEGIGARFVDEFDGNAVSSKDAGALKTSLWELAALQHHYHPTVSTLVSFVLYY